MAESAAGISSDKLQLFEKEPIGKAVMKLSVPTVCSNLVMVLYSLADTFFVGLINSPVQSAAVALAAPVMLAFNAVNNLFGVGGSSMMSRALGQKDYKTVKEASSFSFYGSLFCSLAFSILAGIFLVPLCRAFGANEETLPATVQYMFFAIVLNAPFSILNVVFSYLVRAEGNTLQAAIGTMSGALLNIALDPLFILVFRMQALGAAVATLIANVFAVSYFLVYLFLKRKTTSISISPKYFTMRRGVSLGVAAVGVPAMIQNLLNVFSQLIMNNIAAFYGTEAVAATGIAYRASMVMMYVSQGIGQGVMPLVGYTYAAGLIKRMKETILFTLKLSLGILLTMTLVYELFPTAIMRAFIGTESVIVIGSQLLRGMAIAMPFLAVDFLAVGVFQATGKGGYSLLLALLRKVAFEIPALIAFNTWGGLYFSIGWSQVAAEVLTSAIGFTLMLRMIHKISDREESIPKV